MQQHTIGSEVSYSGKGLHSGLEVKMVLKPGDCNTGVVFVRTDLQPEMEIHAKPELVSSTVRATTIKENGAEVFTVEHLMAAISMMGIDNIRVEMNSPEPPVTDGSAKVFCELIKQAGVLQQAEEREVYVVDRSFSVYDGNKYMIVKPYNGFRISFTSINKHPLLGTQYFDLELTQENFQREIMAARTVAFTEELEMLKKLGLGKGGNLENCVVFAKDKILSVPRFDDELIRHKILDAVGDLYLLGPIKAHVICVTSGHAFNSAVAKQIQQYRIAQKKSVKEGKMGEKVLIHPTAIIDPGAKLGNGVEVGPYAIIDGDVVLGDGCKVMAHAYIHRYTHAGKNCIFWPGSSIGAEPQDLKFVGEYSTAEIGDNCVFRECCTVHRGTGEGGITRIGNNVLMMAYTHAAHDVQIGNNVIMSNNATLAGHVVVEDRAIVGGLAAVHQFTKIGRNAMIGGMARITQDIPPYMIAAGDPAFVSGLNTIGLERAGFDEEKRLSLKKAFRILYHQKNRLEVAIELIDKEIVHNDATEHLLEFLKQELEGGRGILRTRRG